MGKLWKTKGILSLLFPSLLAAQVSGYIFFSGLKSDFSGQKDLSLFSCLRLNFQWVLGDFRVKISPMLNAMASSPFYSSLFLGADQRKLRPLYLAKDRTASLFLLLDRAQVTFEKGKISLTIGRARYPWGKARLFSILDIFNAYNPFSLSPRRPGADGGRARFYLSGFSWLEGIWIRREGREIYGGALFFSAGNFDFQIGGGQDHGRFWGFAFEGEIKGVGLRGELKKEQGFPTEYVIGADYQMGPKTYFMVEYLSSNGSFYPPMKVLTLELSHQITPLLTADFYIIGASPRGRAIWGNLTYSASDNLDVNFGLFLTSSFPFPVPEMDFLSWKLYF